MMIKEIDAGYDVLKSCSLAKCEEEKAEHQLKGKK